MKPLVVGIAGGSGSGKTFLSHRIAEAIGDEFVAAISMDQYFRSEVGERSMAASVNFDHPSHLDIKQLIADLNALRAGKAVRVPTYDFLQMRQIPGSLEIQPKPVIVVEGLFILAEPVVSLCDLTCFLDVASDERLLGRILRDVKEREASIEEVVDRYQRFVRPAYQIFVAPTMQNADVVVDFTYHRSLFTRMIVELLKNYVIQRPPTEEFVQSIRTESYAMGFRPEEGFMSLTTDILKLGEAYPEQTSPRGYEKAMVSPAAARLGRRLSHHR